MSLAVVQVAVRSPCLASGQGRLLAVPEAVAEVDGEACGPRAGAVRSGRGSGRATRTRRSRAAPRGRPRPPSRLCTRTPGEPHARQRPLHPRTPRPGRGGADTGGASGAPRPPCHALGAHRPGLPAQVAVTLQEAFASPRELGAARTGVPQTSELLSSPWSHPCAGDKARTADPTEGLGHQAARRRLMSCSWVLAPGADAQKRAPPAAREHRVDRASRMCPGPGRPRCTRGLQSPGWHRAPHCLPHPAVTRG